VFVNYSLSPEAKYPTAIEEIYTVLQWIADSEGTHQLDGTRIAVAGDSVGGNMTAALTLMAKQRGGPAIAPQLLYYPVTDADFDTGSYHQFATGYWLRRDAMQWFWDQYTADPAARAEITASPLRASLDDLAGLPSALVIVSEADVLRDEGEAYAAKLRAAGVPVTAVYVDPAKFREIFAADVEQDLARVLAVSQRPLAAAALTEKATSAAWRTKPTWAVVSTADHTINPDVERFGYSRAGVTRSRSTPVTW
jgi:acetyl esterase/lipase